MSRDYRKNRQAGDSIQQRAARAGKGSVQRPRQITDAEWAERYARAFPKRRTRRRT